MTQPEQVTSSPDQETVPSRREGVSNDGSPVDVYLALPAEPELALVRSTMPAGASVLELGCGAGRITNHLVADGHEVVAVDDSPEMLQYVTGATKVLADIWRLDLRRRFDVVLAASHLINSRSRAARRSLLEVCRRHLHDDGRVIVQRYPSQWQPSEQESERGPVRIRLHDVQAAEGGFRAAVTYSIGARSWTQRFDAALVDDVELTTLAAATGLIVSSTLERSGEWVVLTVAST